jgi:predicted DNA-binding transcriptional regulator YafY
MVLKTKRIPESTVDDLRWSVERRLAFIEDRLFWLGEINRAALVTRFGVSMSQASADISHYLAANPAGVDYDRSAKRYVALPTFRPMLQKPDARRFLGELRLVEAGLLEAGDTMLGLAPPFAATPLPDRPIDPYVLRTVFQAIRSASSIETTYQSMSRPKPALRTIEPHALVFDGFRWHARAFDRETGEFRDFVLGRMRKARISGERETDPAQDAAWNDTIELEIAPHPGLSEAQAKAIALDYGMTTRSARLPVRRALLYYALKRLGLDHDADSRPPNAQQIVLLNRDAVQRQLSDART